MPSVLAGLRLQHHKPITLYTDATSNGCGLCTAAVFMCAENDMNIYLNSRGHTASCSLALLDIHFHVKTITSLNRVDRIFAASSHKRDPWRWPAIGRCRVQVRLIFNALDAAEVMTDGPVPHYVLAALLQATRRLAETL